MRSLQAAALHVQARAGGKSSPPWNLLFDALRPVFGLHRINTVQY
jgi:hypothetical protein